MLEISWIEVLDYVPVQSRSEEILADDQAKLFGRSISDARKVSPEKLKTVLRFKIKK
jgi:hypothetical protein